MKINTADIDSTDTFLQGYINYSYADLVNILGEPNDEYDVYKSDAEWVIEWNDKVITTIYNYKDGINYLGLDGCPVEDITKWRIGGNSSKALEYIKLYLGITSII